VLFVLLQHVTYLTSWRRTASQHSEAWSSSRELKAKWSHLIHSNYLGTLPEKTFQEYNPNVNRSFGRRRTGLEDNIKMALKFIFEYVGLNSSGAWWFQWQAFVKMVMKRRVLALWGQILGTCFFDVRVGVVIEEWGWSIDRGNCRSPSVALHSLQFNLSSE